MSNTKCQRGWWALGVALAVAGIAARGCIWRPGTQHAGAHFDRGQNAAWLSVDWSKDAHTAGEVRALADDLAHHHVQTVFVYVSYLKPGGHFNSTFDHATEFAREFKAACPDATVEAWIGIPVNKPSIGGHGYARIDDPAVRAEIADFCRRLVSEMGFDGVHLDPEPIPGGDVDTLQLMDDVRAAIGHDKTLSLATRSIIPVWGNAPVPPAVGLWQASYYSRVAERVDEIAVMTYDSTMLVPWLYEQWARFQVIGITRATQGTDVRLLFGVPTSEEETWTHHPRAENMRSGLQGIIAGLNDADAMPQAVTGVAIYPHWETDAAEWTVYDRLWLGK